MFRYACVQPRFDRDLPEKHKLQMALNYIDNAADAGVRLLAFPEGFPGPYYGKTDWSAFDAISAKAKQRNINVIYGEVVPDRNENKAEVYNLVAHAVGADGKLIGSYARMQPAPDEVNFPLMNGKLISPGNEYFLHDIEGVKIGLLICSEIFVPELSRVLALNGAELIFAHIGGMLYELRDTWRCIIWARAIENLCYTSTCYSLFGMEDGLALIAGPEKMLGELDDEGMLVADLDIERIRWLRSQDESLALPKPYRVVPGLLRYRRPELYGKLVEMDVERLDFYRFRQ